MCAPLSFVPSTIPPIRGKVIFVRARGNGAGARFAGDRVRSGVLLRKRRVAAERGADPGAAACENDAAPVKEDDGAPRPPPRRRIGQTTSLLAFTARVRLSR